MTCIHDFASLCRDPTSQSQIPPYFARVVQSNEIMTVHQNTSWRKKMHPIDVANPMTSTSKRWVFCGFSEIWRRVNNEVRLSLIQTPGRRSHFDSSGERVADANLAIRFYSERARWRNCFVATLCLIAALCVPSGVQEGAGGGDEGEDGDRPEDEAVPALDEERRSGPADLQRRMRSSASRADNTPGAAWGQTRKKKLLQKHLLLLFVQREIFS